MKTLRAQLRVTTVSELIEELKYYEPNSKVYFCFNESIRDNFTMTMYPDNTVESVDLHLNNLVPSFYFENSNNELEIELTIEKQD